MSAPSASFLSPTRPVESAGCFHCGLPVPAGSRWTSRVLESPREFCCGGCLAIAEEITAAGLADYYRLRTETAPPPAERLSPPDEALFDREELQASFVRRVGAHRQVSLLIEGVRCPACVWINEERLRSEPGVVEAHVVYASRRAVVTWDPGRVRLSRILGAVSEIGYRARPFDASHRAALEAEAARRDGTRLVFAGVIGMMVMNLALAAYVLGGPDAGGRLPLWETFGRWGCLVASAIILAYPGQDFFAGAWRDLRRRRTGMDVPVALGLAAAWAGSAWATWRGTGPVYFDAIAMLVFFVLLARAAETKARLSAAMALDAFAEVRPQSARRIRADGTEEVVAAMDLSPGDVVAVAPGEVVPGDGTLLEGSSAFDEAILTGEPWPKPRRPGDDVIAGSGNLEQPVRIRVTRGGESSTLAEIGRLVEKGLASRPPSAELADRLAGWLVGGVLVLSAATALVWALREPARALPTAIAVLIVTCPCALALATPVVLTVAAGRLARAGILPLRMSALETLARARTAVFDKTGTLTLPSLRVSGVHGFEGLGRDEALAIAAALEEGHPHPIARAVASQDTAAPDAGEREHEPGVGVSGCVKGRRWWLGRPAWAAGDALLPAAALEAISEARGSGDLVALLCDRRGAAAVLTFTEEPRAGASDVAAALRREEVRRCVLLSGDAEETVESFGRRFDFDEAHGGRTPAEKLEWIRTATGRGGGVLFVGDGLNDAPTLAAAGASISFGDAPQISRLSSDFVVLGTDLAAVGAARQIARRARRLLVQNVAWALAYNAVAVPLAAAGVVTPWLAAVGMSGSSLLVVANAARVGRPLGRGRALSDAGAAPAAGARR